MYQAIKQFLKPVDEGGAYTDERLAMLLAHAEDGKLAYDSCCCLVGTSNADHALRSEIESVEYGNHYYLAKYGLPKHAFDDWSEVPALNGVEAVELEFMELGNDADRCAKLIPLIKAEIERRNEITQNVASEVLALT